MSDERRLRERLRALASAGLSGADGRLLRGPGRDALLLRLLAEIDRAIMPRLVRISASDGSFLVVEVANRRLSRITSGDGHPSLKALTGTEFTADPGDDTAALRALFDTLAETGALTVRSEALDHELDPERAGLSARKLAELLDLPPPADAPADAAEIMDAFLAAIGDHATAWFILSEGAGSGAGNADALEAIEAQADGLPPAPPDQPASVIAIRGPDQAHGYTIAADAGEVRLVLAVPEESLGPVVDAWRGITTPPPALTGQ